MNGILKETSFIEFFLMEFCFRIYIDEDSQRTNMDKLYFHPDTLPCNSHIPEQNSSDTNI